MNTPVLLQQVLQLWQQVLPSATLQPDTHFFLAGGDSLLLLRLLLRVEQQLGVRLHLQDIGEFSTPRKMALVCTCSTAEAIDSAASLPTPPVPTPHIASSSQQGLWWSEQQAGNCGLYNNTLMISLAGALDVLALATAIDLLLQQFPLLASGLAVDTASRCLLVRPTPTPARLGNAIMLEHTALEPFLAKWAARPFELQKEVFRCQLLRHARLQHTLLLCVHHCASDGWSGGLLLQQLARNYRELCRDSQWQPPETDHRFARHCEQQQRWLAGEQCRQHLRWWRHCLRGADAASLQLPWRPVLSSWPYVLQRLCWPLPDSLLQQVPAACIRHGCTPFSLLATALAVALQQIGGGTRPLIGFPFAGRTTLQEEHSVGCYMQLLPLWLDAATDSLWPALLQRNHAALQAVLAHAVPLPDLVKQLRPLPLPDGNAWFDVVLALQNFPLAVPDWSPLTASCHDVPATHGQYALKLEVTGGVIRAEYASALIDRLIMQQLLQVMQTVLTALVGSCD